MSKARELASLGDAYSDGALSNRNLIINGAMVIDQRNGGSAVTVSAAGSYYGADRFNFFKNSSANFTIQQSSVAPQGFNKSLSATVTSAASSTAAQNVVFGQSIEGFNTAHLHWGSANASTLTLSFWVRSSLTGTYCVAFRNAAFNRSYVAEYTINTADTWEQKTITVSGDTTGTWETGNLAGIRVVWDLGSGSDAIVTAETWSSGAPVRTTNQVDWANTSSATFYLTGVQFEIGDTVTPFEHRSYGQEMALCQRYYTKIGGDALADIYGAAYITGGGFILDTLTLPVKMRAAPTGTKVGTWTVSNVAQPTIPHVSTTTFILFASGATIGQGVYYNPALTGYLTFDAEL